MRDNIVGHELPSGSIPSPDSDWQAIETFALTFNAYVDSSFDEVADAANRAWDAYRKDRTLPSSIEQLRTCLFFEQRRYRHFGRAPKGEAMDYVRALLQGIRAAVRGEYRSSPARTDAAGRAYAGSQLQIQLWVNCRRMELDRSILKVLHSLAESNPGVFRGYSGDSIRYDD